MCELRHTSLVVQKMHLRTPSPPAEKTTARLRYMRKKNRALVLSMNLDTPHPMNAAAGLCVLLRIGGRAGAACGAAPIRTLWMGEETSVQPDCFCGPDGFRKM
jgi:hypothetical protein